MTDIIYELHQVHYAFKFLCCFNVSPDACGEQVHRNFISPPSLWPGCVLQKYHYTPAVSSRYTGAAHISVHMVLLTRQTDSRYPAGNVSGLTMKLSRWGHGDVFVYKDKREGEESNAV